MGLTLFWSLPISFLNLCASYRAKKIGQPSDGLMLYGGQVDGVAALDAHMPKTPRAIPSADHSPCFHAKMCTTG